MSKIIETYIRNENAIDIQLDDGRCIRVVLDSQYNPGGIKVIRYDPDWNGVQEFVEFGNPFED